MASEEEGDGDDSNGETTAIPTPIDRITKDAVTFSSPKDFLTTSPNMPSSSILSYQVLGWSRSILARLHKFKYFQMKFLPRMKSRKLRTDPLGRPSSVHEYWINMYHILFCLDSITCITEIYTASAHQKRRFHRPRTVVYGFFSISEGANVMSRRKVGSQRYWGCVSLPILKSGPFFSQKFHVLSSFSALVCSFVTCDPSLISSTRYLPA